ncbi:SSI family serine proteinase inhibitor [Actinokineospora iranica]|uniref:Subtilisin inhibitor-like n=1 Tax=Actinokineospora iranica TaxID=1271860 RepID=A0A1G6JGL7_9PSEU|nr:SSI family serine proteinase inhibitor [Actinokineospora iranica]SDC17076.1 Subtilisin inhibitor-like [Actinokineospora iranica]
MLRRTFAAAIAVAAATAMTPAAAAAPRAQTHLTLTVGAPGQTPATAVLRCGPTGGSHPRATAACAAIAQVDGDFDALNVGPDRPCTMEYAPLVVTANGLWQNRPVAHERVHPNRCALEVATGSVFAL